MTHDRKPALTALAIALASLASLVHAENLSPNLQVNGFATAGGSWVSEDYSSTYLGSSFASGAGFDEKGSYQHDSVLGLQVSYALNDRTDMVGQLVSAGRNEFQTEAEWAYLAYRVNDNFRVRAGRFAAPWYMYTENYRVGQAYPWARLPVELYAGIPINSLNGLDLLYRQPLGDWNLDAQLSFGGASNDYVKVTNNRGLNLNLSRDAFNLHLGYSESDVSININKDPFGNSAEQLAYLMDQYGVNTSVQDQPASFADFGMTFDDGNWMAAAEFGALRIDGYGNDFDAGYVSIGHYVGKWLPYVLASKINIINGDQCTSTFAPALANASSKTAQAGLAVAATTATVNGLTAVIMNPASSATDIALAMAEMPDAMLLQQQAGTMLAQASAGESAANQATVLSCLSNEQTSYSLGFRYDATKNVSVKLQVDEVRDFHGTQGYFSGVSLSDDENTQVVTFNVNAAF